MFSPDFAGKKLKIVTLVPKQIEIATLTEKSFLVDLAPGVSGQ
jgi:hypothetical protein